MRGGPTFNPLNRPLGDTRLIGHIRLSQLKIKPTPRNTLADLGKNSVICKEF
ncbi:MAG TPA: hypothetical protein VJ437_02095 [Acidiferrobacterales bacterium]|nr:hypothetical protein [Acidiferrobacterales bacterium]